MPNDDLTAPMRSCTSLAEARAEIESVDRQMVALLRQRRGLVTQVYAFTSRGDDQPQTDRFLALLRQRRQWAESAGIDPNLVETLFTLIVNTFTTEELAARKPKP